MVLSADMVAPVGSFGRLCFLGFGGSPLLLFPDFAERETAGASL